MSRILIIPWNLAKLVKNCPGIIVSQRLTVPKQMVLLKEQFAESRKELNASGVAIRLGRKMVGGFHGMLLLSAERTRLFFGMGRHHLKGNVENRSEGP